MPIGGKLQIIRRMAKKANGVRKHAGKDLIKKYRPKYADTMYGWYWVWEINTNQWNNSYANKRLVDAMNINLDFLNKETPDSM